MGTNNHTPFSAAAYTAAAHNAPLSELDRAITYAGKVLVGCDGALTWSAGVLTWSGSIHIYFNSAAGLAIHNSIAAANIALSDLEFAYVTLNETNDTVLTVSKAAITTASASNYLTYSRLVLGYRNTSNDLFYPVALAGVPLGGQSLSAAKLSLNQGTADDEIESYASDDIDHGMTDIIGTHIYGFIRKFIAENGGLSIVGLSDADWPGFIISGIIGSNTPTLPALALGASKKDGTTSSTLAADEYAIGFYNELDLIGSVKGNGAWELPYLSLLKYLWTDDFDQEANGVQLESGINADFWTAAGTNYAAANVTYIEGAGGTLKAICAAADNDSVTIIGLKNFNTSQNPILEARIKIDTKETAAFLVGFADAASAVIDTYPQNCFLVGINSDNAHTFGAAQIVGFSNDDNAGVVYNDCGVAVVSDTYVIIKIDLTDTEQPVVLIDGTKVTPANITGTVKDATALAPYIAVQNLAGGSIQRFVTVDYIKCWQDRG